MNKIQMVDLKGQYNNIKSEVDKAVIDVIESGQFINGPSVNDFSNNLSKYLGVNHVIPCANGTDALQVALMALDLNPGDEVITTDFTFASSVEVIALLGLKPVLVDVEIDTFNIDFNKIEKAVTNKTKAIIPVHLFGQTAEMKKIMDIANKNNLFVIEDNAQAIGSVYRNNNEKVKAGTIGHIGTTSFFPSKNLGCYGDGGAIFTNDDDLAVKMKGLVNHGMYKRYYHDEIGVNSRLDSIQAAILNVKLKYLDIYNKRRIASATEYNSRLESISEIETPYVESDPDSHVFHQYTIKVKNGKRDKLAEFLSSKEIPFGIYYPLGFHEQKAYRNNFNQSENFENTNIVKDQVISLPMHTELSKSQIDFICNSIKEFFSNN